jgi:sodium-dependent dicarboxylate transporter 2/3/5
MLIVIALVNFLTEITSNIATASMILPKLGSIALAMDIHPYSLMIGATLAASCAFMLPVATPPNAIVFGSGYLKMKDMAVAGFIMNIFSILLILFFTYLLLSPLWGIEMKNFPEEFKR